MIKVWNFTYKENYDIQAGKNRIVYVGLEKKKKKSHLQIPLSKF